MNVSAAVETTLTGNQPRMVLEAKKLKWGTTEAVDRGVNNSPQASLSQSGEQGNDCDHQRWR
jgi:hypothetical protein